MSGFNLTFLCIICFRRHNLIPEIVTIGEERKYNLSRRLPVLVVGTKADQTCAIRPEHRGWVDKVLNDNGGGEIKLVSEVFSNDGEKSV